MSERKKARMWVVEFDHHGEHVGWFIQEAEGESDGARFYTKEKLGNRWSDGNEEAYPIGSWAFATEDEARHAAAVSIHRDLLQAMDAARKTLIDVAMKAVRVAK